MKEDGITMKSIALRRGSDLIGGIGVVGVTLFGIIRAVRAFRMDMLVLFFALFAERIAKKVDFFGGYPCRRRVFCL